MKKSQKNFFFAVLGTIAFLGIAGTLAAGVLTNWTYSTDPFAQVKVESREVNYDGMAHEINIEVPSDATYTVKITNNDAEVTTCVEVGVYDYAVTVSIDDLTKSYEATLTIKAVASDSTADETATQSLAWTELAFLN